MNENTNTVSETVNAFDEFYNTVEKKRVSFNVLECLFDNFADLTYKHTESYKYIDSKKSDILSELLVTLNENQKKLFEQYDELQVAELQDYGLQQFVTGIVLTDAIVSEKSGFCNNNKILNDILDYIKKLKEME